MFLLRNKKNYFRNILKNIFSWSSENYPQNSILCGALIVVFFFFWTLLHSEQPKLYEVLAVPSAIGLKKLL